jgi:hypothetical protein
VIRKWAVRSIWPVGWAVIFMSTIFTILQVAPWLETRYFPVVDKLLIERVEWQGPSKSHVYAAFRKLRNCEYKGISWYRVGDTPDEPFTRVAIATLRRPGDTSSPNRPIGYQKSGPWEVMMPDYEIRTKSVVELEHDCHLPWRSRTHFYP